MTIDISGNNSLQKLASAYQTNDADKAVKDDYLGREDFLTMLVAQLQNQDPLNPMEGSDFSAQLAQFSSLEQLVNLGDSMDDMVQAVKDSSETDVATFIGKEVTGNVNSVEVAFGSASGGYYNLADSADVMVSIYNDSGHLVRTLYPGQQTPGEYALDWDGKDNGGKVVEDGTFTYDVLANSGSGFSAASTTVTGKVDGVVYQNDKAYLQVQGALISPDSIVKVSENVSTETPAMTVLDYLGKEIAFNDHILAIEGEKISGKGIRFDLENQESVEIDIKDAEGNVVNTLNLSPENTMTGENVVMWDGTDSAGNKVSDGIYSYSVTSESGTSQMVDSGEVTGIKYLNGAQYLVVGDNEDLVNISSITGVN